METQCFYGCGQNAQFTTKTGNHCCSKNRQACPEVRRKNSVAISAAWKAGVLRGHPGGKRPDNKGRPCSEETKRKLSVSAKGRPGRPHSEETRKKISELHKQHPEWGGYQPGSGRGKHGWYQGYWCDSTWELAWIIYHLELGWAFKRNTKKFQYEFEGKQGRYIPDFVLDDGTFVEVKGYFTPLVEAKIASVPGIKVFGPVEMKPILASVTSKFGSNLVLLYGEASR